MKLKLKYREKKSNKTCTQENGQSKTSKHVKRTDINTYIFKTPIIIHLIYITEPLVGF